jgi:hypothetical protein
MRMFVFPPIFLALSACASKPPVEVSIPVPVPCITTDIPEPVYPSVEADAGLYVRVQALLAERELRKGYEEQLKAAVAGCRGLKK